MWYAICILRYFHSIAVVFFYSSVQLVCFELYEEKDLTTVIITVIILIYNSQCLTIFYFNAWIYRIDAIRVYKFSFLHSFSSFIFAWNYAPSVFVHIRYGYYIWLLHTVSHTLFCSIFFFHGFQYNKLDFIVIGEIFT